MKSVGTSPGAPMGAPDTTGVSRMGKRKRAERDLRDSSLEEFMKKAEPVKAPSTKPKDDDKDGGGN